MVNLGFLGRQKYFKKLSILSFISPLHVKRLAIYFFSHFLSTSLIFIHSTTFHHLSSIQSPLLDKESIFNLAQKEIWLGQLENSIFNVAQRDISLSQ